jgi:DNA end-binding protein Ku
VRSLWKGALTVGKVSIPVTLHKAGEHDHPGFRSLHKECGTPVEQQRKCPTCDVVLEAGYSETVRGFEVAEGQFVTIENKELEAALGGKELKLDRFVSALDVLPAQASAAYWLLPESSAFARSAYATLREALLRSSLVGLGRLVYFTKEHVALVRPALDSLLSLETLYVGAELRDVTEQGAALAKVEVGEKELGLMTQVLEQRMRLRYSAAQLERSYGRRVLDLVAEKAKRGTITVAPAPAAATVDLVDALTRSIKKRTGGRQKTTV